MSPSPMRPVSTVCIPTSATRPSSVLMAAPWANAKPRKWASSMPNCRSVRSAMRAATGSRKTICSSCCTAVTPARSIPANRLPASLNAHSISIKPGSTIHRLRASRSKRSRARPPAPPNVPCRAFPTRATPRPTNHDKESRMQHFKIKPGVPLAEQAELGHNRWHPDLPFLSSVKPGEAILIESLDFLDAQIKDNDSVDDVANVDLTRAHPLTGPFHVEGAEPGDLLVIDLLDIKPITPVGFSGVFSKENGGGFLADYFPAADKAIWDLRGLYATSRHIPGVRIAGLTHPGLMGCLPSHDLLAEWNRREAPLAAKGLAKPPDPSTAVLRGLTGAKFDEMAKIAARTVPPREHGGNTDIKDLSAGTRIFFPVYVKGAGFSMGDLHFSQGDGEIGFCGAIEMDGVSHVGFDLIKGGMAKYNITSPIFMPSVVKPHYEQWLTFEGISVENGVNYYLDATVAYRQACLKAIDYLTHFGYTGSQAYMLLTAAPVEGRIGGIVDIPNCACTVSLPTSIFDQDITPKGMLNDKSYWGRKP